MLFTNPSASEFNDQYFIISTTQPYSAKFWRGNILANLADSPATAKNLPSKISNLNNNANSVMAQLPKYHHPNAFPSIIRQKFSPSKILRYTVLSQ